MKASRLLSIMLLLQARGRMTAHALAEEFEVSVRTIYRDVDQLSAAGVPIYADKGPYGGFALLDGYRTRLTGLSGKEAEALFLSGLPGPAAELGLGEAMAQARLKLLAAIPESARGDAERVDRRFHLDPIGWFQGAGESAHLRNIAMAVWETRLIRIRYDSWKAVVDRTVAPLGLVLKAGIWYLVARVGEHVRTYRISYIQTLDVLPDGFERPSGFDLAAHWAAASRAYESRMLSEEAVVRLSPEGLKQLARIGQALEQALLCASNPDDHGWRTATIPIESIAAATAQLLPLHGEVEALAPAELRTAIADAAQRIFALHRDVEIP